MRKNKSIINIGFLFIIFMMNFIYIFHVLEHHVTNKNEVSIINHVDHETSYTDQVDSEGCILCDLFLTIDLNFLPNNLEQILIIVFITALIFFKSKHNKTFAYYYQKSRAPPF